MKLEMFLKIPMKQILPLKMVNIKENLPLKITMNLNENLPLKETLTLTNILGLKVNQTLKMTQTLMVD